MKLERDNIPLNKDFPFQISRVILNSQNSHPDTWHWHSYLRSLRTAGKGELLCQRSGIYHG